MPEQICKHCGISKDLDTNFYKSKYTNFGYESKCLDCKALASQAKRDRLRPDRQKRLVSAGIGSAREEKKVMHPYGWKVLITEQYSVENSPVWKLEQQLSARKIECSKKSQSQ